MIIIGVTHPISLNNAACIFVDGVLTAFAEEERFIRLKHAPHIWPSRAIEYCLSAANIAPSQVDITAIGFAFPERESLKKVCLDAYPHGVSSSSAFEFNTNISFIANDLKIMSLGKRKYYDHHLSHAVSTSIPSGFAATNIISLDGWGGAHAGLLGWQRDGEDVTVFKHISPENSWGMLYELVTYYVGFRPHSGEGKTMGLASYGVVNPDLLPDFCDTDLGLPDVPRYRAFLEEKYIGPRRGPLTDIHQNLAATLQFYYERSLIAIGRELTRASGIRHFALAGGVALNCSGNGALAQQEFVDNIFIQPASHDSGTALGAAILAHRESTGIWPKLEFHHASWGSGFTQDSIRGALDFAGAKYLECNPAVATAEALSQDKLVGFFQGRAEIGPRALGNRSILANPAHAINKDRVNLKVKRRENWRPFAPSILHERYSEIVDARVDSPFMILAFQARDNWKQRIPAVVHVDGSCRPQSVVKSENAVYHEAISEFNGRTGLPLVLNTSFNLEDEPIVNSPEHAIATFFRSGLDTLVIGNFIVHKTRL